METIEETLTKHNKYLKQHLSKLIKNERVINKRLKNIKESKEFGLLKKIQPPLLINPKLLKQKIKDFNLIRKSGLFASSWYFNEYKDIHEDFKKIFLWKYRDSSIFPIAYISRYFAELKNGFGSLPSWAPKLK